MSSSPCMTGSHPSGYWSQLPCLLHRLQQVGLASLPSPISRGPCRSGAGATTAPSGGTTATQDPSPLPTIAVDLHEGDHLIGKSPAICGPLLPIVKVIALVGGCLLTIRPFLGHSLPHHSIGAPRERDGNSGRSQARRSILDPPSHLCTSI